MDWCELSPRSIPWTQKAPPSLVPRFPTGASIDDVALARYVATGDPRAAALLWDRFAPLVRGLLRRTLGPSADVDDLLQETFIGLHRTLPGLRDPRVLRSFVVSTALRVARSELRKRRVRRFLSLTATGSVPEVAETGATDPDARRAVKRLYEVLDTMDDRGRVAFVLRHVEGYELTEVAESMGCSLATVKRVLARVEDRVSMLARREPLLAAYAPAVSHDEEQMANAAE